jgi:hypothetical protein
MLAWTTVGSMQWTADKNQGEEQTILREEALS